MKELKKESIMKKSISVWGLSLCFILNVSGCSTKNTEFASQIKTSEYFDKIQHDPSKVRMFLKALPKGGDLHHHLDGAIYAESYLSWAAADGRCIKKADFTIYNNLNCQQNQEGIPVVELIKSPTLVEQAINSMSVRNYQNENVSGHDKFFSTFSKFSGAVPGREGEMLAEVTQRAAEQNIHYLEIMVVFGIFDAVKLEEQYKVDDIKHAVSQAIESKGIKKVTAEVIQLTNNAEHKKAELLACNSASAKAGCHVEVRYLPAVIRVLPKNSIIPQTALAYQLINEDERYVGVNFVAPEDYPVALNDYDWHMRLIKEFSAQYPKVADNVTLHAGELTAALVANEQLKNHITNAVYIAGANRIGHGVSILHEDSSQALMSYMAKEKILVEINLTSNDVILGIKDKDHPFSQYISAGVPMALSTDDEGIYRIDLTHEYQRAVKSYQLSYSDLKSLSRNALEYSFLEGESLFSDYSSQSIAAQCKHDLLTKTALSDSCSQFLKANEKAKLQWDLEKRFIIFESNYTTN